MVVSIASRTCGYSSQGGNLTFWCTKECQDARRHVRYADAPRPYVPPGPELTPAAAFVRLAAQVTERLAVLDRVRPILSAAIDDAKGDEAIAAITVLGVKIVHAILADK